jgi:uncharacterized protein
MSTTTFSPVAANERIVTLDVIRGVALLGIFLMNVEFFNRPIADLDSGLPLNVTGLDYWAGWFVHVFVRGKFWTMFSLLFGMGFAVMLTRAELAGRDFFKPYVRRTLALAVFGALHYILLWAGDILFAYAIGAAFLLVIFHARPKVMVSIGAAALATGAVLGSLTALGVAKLPWQPFLGLGVPVLLLGTCAWAVRRAPLKSLRNVGLLLYLVPCMGMMIFGAVSPQVPQAERDRVALAEATTPEKQAEVRKEIAEAAKKRKEHIDTVANEARVMSQGTYAEALAWRAQHFPKQAATDVGFALFFVTGMFLLGAWFVRSGLMANPAAHLDVFRKLAMFGLPLGLGIGLIAAAIATSHRAGQNDALYTFSMGLSMLGNLAACLGYVGVVVLLFHSRFRAWVAPFAPAGRMALTNYLTQSVLGTLFFYGYGLGHYGLGRAWQIVFVVVVFAVQLVVSRWWLSRFRYGPMEWLWRSFTYLRLPTMRQGRLQPA